MTREAPWWRDAVGYEIYLRSYRDGDGDGVGDMAGLLERLDHPAWLGVDIVWITPFYPSPMRDHGYDVADYLGVEPAFGDLADVDAVIERAHALGLRVVIDLVPNHTSSDHPWFQEARSSKDNPYRDYYIWRDPGPDGGPPNNWVSHFGVGPAWTFDEATGQYWLHLFLPEQPDLNWRNPAVAEEFDRILTFWLERGVDGFRIDVAHALVKHPELPDLPPASGDTEPDMPIVQTSLAHAHAQFEHVHDVDQPEVLDVYRRWRGIADAYDAVLIGEVYLLEPERLERYLAGDGLHLAFWFGPLHVPWDPASLRWVLRRGAALPPGAVAWVQGSHDRPRPPTRFGGGEAGKRRALVLATLMAGLPGTLFLYQGEECGLADGTLDVADAQDPVAVHAQDVAAGRDGCRTPMPWAPGGGMGFSTHGAPWLPLGRRSDEDTVAHQRSDPGSWLHRYRRLLAARAALADARDDPVAWLTDEGPVIAYRRGAHVVAGNCGDEPAGFELPAGEWRTLYATGDDGGPWTGRVTLGPLEAVVLTG